MTQKERKASQTSQQKTKSLYKEIFTKIQ